MPGNGKFQIKYKPNSKRKEGIYRKPLFLPLGSECKDICYGAPHPLQLS